MNNQQTSYNYALRESQELNAYYPGIASSTILQAASDGRSQAKDYSLSSNNSHFESNIRQATPSLAATATINGAEEPLIPGLINQKSHNPISVPGKLSLGGSQNQMGGGLGFMPG